MNTHVHAWIPAYYDGELSGSRLNQVRSHLEQCAECRAELEALSRLSVLLHSVPAPALSPARFTVQVKLRLPAVAWPQSGWQKPISAAWRWAPIGLITLWAVCQAGLAVTGLLMLAGQSDLLGLPQAASLSGWGWAVALINSFLAGSVNAAWLELTVGWLELGLVNLLVTAGLAVLLWGWVASWWAQRRRLPSSNNDYFQPEVLGSLN